MDIFTSFYQLTLLVELSLAVLRWLNVTISVKEAVVCQNSKVIYEFISQRFVSKGYCYTDIFVNPRIPILISQLLF